MHYNQMGVETISRFRGRRVGWQRHFERWIFCLWVFVTALFPVLADSLPGGSIIPRLPAASLRMPSAPEPDPYSADVALSYTPTYSVVALVTPPGETNRLFHVNQYGLVMVITNLAEPNSSVFLDISERVERGGEAGLLGMTFHPGYRTNGFFYLYYTTRITTSQGVGLHDRLSRFSVSPTDPNQALSQSELPLITQFDPNQNHNGGDLKFGPDGYLYVSLGDGGGGLDQFNNGQRIDKDFFSGILRLDVDRRPESLPPNPHPASSGYYAIPPDNPFVTTAPLTPDDPLSPWIYSGVSEFNGSPVDPKKVRTEFYAVGLRNPWRFSFDEVTGELYCNDTGQDAREEVNLIRSGGNYGWAFMEGSIPGPKFNSMPSGVGSSLLPPLIEYDHSQGRRAIVGGILYRGTRYPELNGGYIFSDVQGDIGMFRPADDPPRQIRWIGFSRGIATFGLHPATGEILFSDGIESYIRSLQPTTLSPDHLMPPTLEDTGIFTDLTTLQVSQGMVPYEINLPFWSDHALKRRWFGFINPKTSIGFTRNENWLFPSGMTWVKHFDMEMTNGVPSSIRRLETRVLVRTEVGMYGVTYRWGPSVTNAVLVPAFGEDELLEIYSGGTPRPQVWRYPARKECLACHTREGGFALGFNTAQLNRDCEYQGVVTNQISALNQSGFFTAKVSDLETLRILPSLDQSDWSLEFRARAYLAANCSQCHQPGQASPGFWDARISAALPQTGIIHGKLKDSLGDPENRIVVPGRPEKSVLLTRMKHRGTLRMPPLGSVVLDEKAVELITSWIMSLAQAPSTYELWAPAVFPSAINEIGAGDFDADGDGESNLLEFLTQQNPLNGGSTWRVSVDRDLGSVRIRFPRLPDRLFRVEWSDGFENGTRWRSLDVPGNRPFITSKAVSASVVDTSAGASQRFYRVRVLQP